MPTSNAAALTYVEPCIEVILIQSSFLILLNALNWVLDALLYCGLIGQILIGVAFGTPGGQLLSHDTEYVVMQLGYIGLILVVFEGGLSTSFAPLKANLALSACVAITGIAAPIGLSFILSPLAGASSLQCFAAGAALCSTSLGTMFTVLRASGLTSTRVGIVLTTAAMLDDVVGLVIVQVISNLGGVAGASIDALTVVRPVSVSVAFVFLAVVFCRYAVQPATLLLNDWRIAHPGVVLDKLLRQRGTAIALHVALLVVLVTASSYAGSSNLLAAYIAGAMISWWDSEIPHLKQCAELAVSSTSQSEEATRPSELETFYSLSGRTESNRTSNHHPGSGSEIYEAHFHPAVKWILQPFFFASIGFSIPITRMFAGAILWRGIVYAILMIIGKLFCGLWLLRVPGLGIWMTKIHLLDRDSATQTPPPAVERHDGPQASEHKTSRAASPGKTLTGRPNDPSTSPIIANANRNDGITSPTGEVALVTADGQLSPTESLDSVSYRPKPLALYPAAILGLAMVPRGEIGFLVSSIAQSNGVFGAGQSSGESEIFLIATWAIVLCTIIGPLCVGMVVRRLRRLEDSKAESSRNVLGIWDIQALQ